MARHQLAVTWRERQQSGYLGGGALLLEGRAQQAEELFVGSALMRLSTRRIGVSNARAGDAWSSRVLPTCFATAHSGQTRGLSWWRVG